MSKILAVDINAIPSKWTVEDFLKRIKKDKVVWLDTQKQGVDFDRLPAMVLDLDDVEEIKFVENIDGIKFKNINE